MIHHINKRKDKKHVIIARDTEKVQVKIKHLHMVKKKKKKKKTSKITIESTNPNIIKATYNKPTAKMICNSEKLKVFLLNS